MGESWDAEKTGLKNTRDSFFCNFAQRIFLKNCLAIFMERKWDRGGTAGKMGVTSSIPAAFLFGITPVTFDFPKFGVESPSFPQLLKTWGCFVFGLSGCFRRVRGICFPEFYLELGKKLGKTGMEREKTEQIQNKSEYMQGYSVCKALGDRREKLLDKCLTRMWCKFF